MKFAKKPAKQKTTPKKSGGYGGAGTKHDPSRR